MRPDHEASRNRSKPLGSLPKAMPSKWDEAQKWLVGLSGGGERVHGKNRPRNSNADDRRLIGSASQRERYSCSSADGLSAEEIGMALALREEGETKKVDCQCGESLWRVHKADDGCPLAVRSVCVRDMGTEMTPLASHEPSRTPTPLAAGTPVMRSPASSRSSTPGRFRLLAENGPNCVKEGKMGVDDGGEWSRAGVEVSGRKAGCDAYGQGMELSFLESRAVAWDEAEKAKYMARYKREELKIQAWENHEKQKAESAMRKTEVKADRLKAQAQERLTKKLSVARQIAEEKRANAEAKLKEQAARTSERADYIRRTGHLPSLFYFKISSLCR